MKPTSDLPASDNKPDPKEIQERLESLFKKIPELRHSMMIGLGTLHFKRLDDMEFIVLYRLIASPESNIQVRVAPKTLRYIEERRKELGLDKAPSRGEEKEDVKEIFKDREN